MCQFIFLLIQDKDTAEELSADVFVTLWEKRTALSITLSVKAYIYSCGRNAALAYLKNSRESFLSLDACTHHTKEEQNPEERLLYHELEKIVDDSIDKLPPQCRLIFRLHRFDEMKYKEIATVLNISNKTVKKQMGKAIKVLRTSVDTLKR